MLKESTYIDAADNFGTPVGVAHILGYKNKKEQIRDEGVESFNQIEPELDINGIICDAIELGLYQQLQREIFKIKQKGDKRLKERGIYHKAFNQLVKDENYITKSGEIF
jgi:hypothetical protein